MQTQTCTNTPSYQPNPMQNEIPLPSYKQTQKTLKKTQFTIFTQKLNTEKSLQMTINNSLSITSNKPLMVFKVRDPEILATANLKLNSGPETMNTTSSNWIQMTLDVAARTEFQFYPLKPTGKDSYKCLQKGLTPKDTNKIKEFK